MIGAIWVGVVLTFMPVATGTASSQLTGYGLKGGFLKKYAVSKAIGIPSLG